MIAFTVIFCRWSMGNSKEKFDDLVEKLSAQPEVRRSRMFGFDSITVMRKTFALLDGDSMVFKLSGDAHVQALEMDGAVLWNPFGHQKKEWVQIPFRHSSEWEQYAEAARSYVKSLIKVSP